MLEYKLIFCNDGVLRVKYAGKTLIPLEFIQNNKTDLELWVQFKNCTVIFEDGLTLYHYFKAIKPWNEFLSILFNIDIKSYWEQLNKLTLIKKDNSFDWIELVATTEIQPEIEYKKIQENKQIFGTKKSERRLTGNWQMFKNIKLSGFKKNICEHFSLLLTPINEIKNCSLYLATHEIMSVMDFIAKQCEPNLKFIDETSYGFRTIKKPISNISYINIVKHFTLEDVCNGVFSSFAYSPIVQKEMQQNLQNTVIDNETIKEIKQNEDKNQKVVSIFEKKTNSPKIIFSQNYFDSLLQDMKEKQKDWKNMERKLKESNHILKMSNIKESIAPQKHVYNEIIDEIDISTEFKS